MQIIPIILSGGSGTRLWPLSRLQFPKQYLPLVSNNSMLQETILRLNGIDNVADPIIVCNADHRFLVAEQCQEINLKNPTILLEHIGKNTAPAIAAAALQYIKENNDNATLLVLTADHIIQDIKAFKKVINIANKHAERSRLVTFGVMPTNANTGYGYIKASCENIDGAYKVKKFVEKPDKKTAQFYLKEGNYLWNSGMFMFQSNTLIDELTIHSPDILEAVNNAVNNATQDLDFVRLDKEALMLSPSNSIDYAIMEKSNNVVVVPLDAQWNDIGSWSALHDIGIKDKNNNVIKGDVIVKDASNTYINADHHMVVAIGVDRLIIVDTPDATLITTQEKAQEVKDIVEFLEASNRSESATHCKVYRPWGWYDTIQLDENFQVKRLNIKPGAKLSLQMHHMRAEHWVVVNGIATVTKNDQIFTLNKGESTYIPLGVVHSLENKTNEQLEIIEVQIGTYFGEDDIVRFEDIYGRNID